MICSSEGWSDVIVAPDSVYQAVTSLRRVLGDDPRQPTYIETIPRLGHRMVATVTPWVDQSSTLAFSSHASPINHHSAAIDSSAPASRLRISLHMGRHCGSAFPRARRCFLVLRQACEQQALGFSAIAAPQSQKSIAVLPFLDLTDDMNQEPFADGIPKS